MITRTRKGVVDDPAVERLALLVTAVRSDPAAFASIEAMAAHSGIDAPHLNTLFRQHYHTSPVAYLNRIRLTTACNLLADPERQIDEAAFAAGYENVSAFDEHFRRTMRLTPKDYQQLGTTFTLTLPKNYLAWITLKLLARDAESITERVNGNCAVKALTMGAHTVLLHIEWEANSLRCRVESKETLDTSTMQAIHGVVCRMLGLWTHPAGFERIAESNPDVARLIAGRHGLRIPLSTDLFEGLTWSIVGQQVNLAFAYKLRRELARLCGQRWDSNFVAHPTIEAVARLDYADLLPLQFSRRKAEYLIDTARLLASGELTLDPLDAASQIEKRLLAVRGLGPWSVNYVMMRAFGYADCVPLGDTGLTSALQRFYDMDNRPNGSEETAALMQSFAPYRSLATYHLWMSLGGNPA